MDGKYNLSAVVTHKQVPYIWINAVRRLDAVEIVRHLPDQRRVEWLEKNR